MENIEVLAIVAVHLPTLARSPDPDDDLILATAVAGKAEAIVSGDKSGVWADSSSESNRAWVDDCAGLV